MAAMPGLDQLAADHVQFMTLDVNAQAEFLKERRAWKPMMGISSVYQGPGNIETFATVYGVVCKLAHLLSVGLFFEVQEDLGVSYILSAFTEYAVAVDRTAIENTTASTPVMYRLGGVDPVFPFRASP